MRRTVFICLLSVSGGILVLLMLLTIAMFFVTGAAVALLFMLNIGNGDVPTQGISAAEIFANFVGSPLFYAYIADLTLLIGSIIGVAIPQKKTNKV